MSPATKQLQEDARTLLLQTGFSPEQAKQMVEGLNVIESLSQELGELPESTVKELNLLSLPFAGMMVLTSDPDDDDSFREYVSLLRTLLSEVIRAAYQLGTKDAMQLWQGQEDRKDLPTQ